MVVAFFQFLFFPQEASIDLYSFMVGAINKLGGDKAER